MRPRSALFTKQKQGVDFIKGGEGTIYLADIGTGKTATVLTAFADIQREDRAKGFGETRMLVVAPRNVALNTWPDEPSEWQHLAHLKVAAAAGTARRRAMAVEGDADAVAISYDNLAWLMKSYPRGKLPFNVICFDEADKMKDPSTERMKPFYNPFLRKGQDPVRTYSRLQDFDLRIVMTGTPAPEGLTNLWSIQWLATLGEAFGTYRKLDVGARYSHFIENFFVGSKWSWKIEPLDHTAEWVYEKLTPWTFRVELKDIDELPPVHVVDRFYDLRPDVRAKYDQLEREFLLVVEREDEEVMLVEGTNAAVLQEKLRQMAAGFSYGEVNEERKTHWHDQEKMRMWADLRSELMGQQLLTFYNFKAQREKLREFAVGKSKKRPFYCLGGETSDRDAQAWIRAWNDGQITNLVAHPASAGHGLNLHRAGAHHMAFLTLPWSRALYDQAIGRLHRTGQKEKVVVHRFLARDTVDEDVARALEQKGATQRDVLNQMRDRTRAKWNTKRRSSKRSA